MKKLYKLPIVLVLAIILPFTATGQIKIELTPFNIPEVIDEISFLLGDEIKITPTELESFLIDDLIGEYNSEINHPNAESTYEDQKMIIYSWESMGSDLNYSVRMINLLSGEVYSDYTSELSSKFNVDNGLYLTSFRSEKPGFYSSKFIIIEEKPLGFFDHVEDCMCDQLEPSSTADFPSSSNEFVTYEEVQDGLHRFHASIMDPDGNTTEASYYLNLSTQDENLNYVGLPNVCMDNMDYWGNHIFLFADGSPVAKVVYWSLENATVHSLNPDYSGSISYSKCLQESNDSKRIRPKESIFPNPTSDIINIPPSIHNEYDKFLLKNELGQLLIITPSNNSIDISNFPSGIYYLEAVGTKGKETFPISKID